LITPPASRGLLPPINGIAHADTAREESDTEKNKGRNRTRDAMQSLERGEKRTMRERERERAHSAFPRGREGARGARLGEADRYL
jgi:DNA invertase Pin-like site-specific DNA recombinase